MRKDDRRLSRASGYVDSRLFNDGESHDDETDTRRSLILLRRRRYRHPRRRRLLHVVVFARAARERLVVDFSSDSIRRFPRFSSCVCGLREVGTSSFVFPF